jgi:hypothetical protein
MFSYDGACKIFKVHVSRRYRWIRYKRLIQITDDNNDNNHDYGTENTVQRYQNHNYYDDI